MCALVESKAIQLYYSETKKFINYRAILFFEQGTSSGKVDNDENEIITLEAE